MVIVDPTAYPIQNQPVQLAFCIEGQPLLLGVAGKGTVQGCTGGDTGEAPGVRVARCRWS